VARLYTVSPPAAKRGTEVVLTLGGADLDGAAALHSSLSGITAAPEPPAQNQPAGRFRVKVDAAAAAGLCEVRASGAFGITNPRYFLITDLAEGEEKEPNNARDAAQRIAIESAVSASSGGGGDVDYYVFSAAKAQRVVVECLAQRLDSRLDATLVLFDALGKELDRDRGTYGRDPVLDFTAPADGDYTVEVHDGLFRGSGEYFYHLSFSAAPRLEYVFPPCGMPGTEGEFAIWGQNLPGGKRIDAVAVRGQPLDMVLGRIRLPPLDPAADPAGRLRLPAGAWDLAGFEYRFEPPGGAAGAAAASNAMFLGFASGPVVSEIEPNDAPAEAQKLAVPGEYAGRFFPDRDRDWIEFEAKEGEVFWIEVISQRLGLSTDPLLVAYQVVRGDQGETLKEIAAVDDGAGAFGNAAFGAPSDDPLFRFQAPAGGAYRLHVRDQSAEAEADPRRVYRVSVRRPEPGFKLLAVPAYPFGKGKNPEAHPWSLLLRRGGVEVLDVHVERRDGFDGAVEVFAEGLPAGVRSAGATVIPGRNTAALVLEAAEDAKAWAGTFTVRGKASISGSEVVRAARCGTVVWPALPNQSGPELRLSASLGLAVRDLEPSPLLVEAAVDLKDGKALEMSRAGKLEVPVRLSARSAAVKSDVDVEAVGLPPGVEAKELKIKAGANEGKLELTFKKDAALGSFRLHLKASAKLGYSPDQAQADAAMAVFKAIEKEAADLAAAAQQALAARDAAVAAEKESQDAVPKAVQAKEVAFKAAQEKALAAAEALKRVAAMTKEAPASELQGLRQAVDKASAEAQAAVAALADAGAAYENSMSQTKARSEAKAAAEAAIPAAEERAKQKAAERDQADQRAKEIAKNVKPKDVDAVFASRALPLVVAPAPVRLVVETPPAALKRGASLDLTVKVERLYGFAGPVEIAVAFPSGVQGLAAAKVTLPPDQSQIVLKLEAAAQAGIGMLDAAVSAKLKFGDQDLETTERFSLRVEDAAAAAAGGGGA
jgi:hypothetical protein